VDLVCGMWGKRIKEMKKDEGVIHMRDLCGIWKSLESDGRNGKRCKYLLCDFNRRWLKDLSILCCIVVVLSVEGKIRYVM